MAKSIFSKEWITIIVLIMFKQKHQQADIISILKKETARNRILSEKTPSNLKSAQKSLEEAFNIHFALVCQASTLTLSDGGCKRKECCLTASTSATAPQEPSGRSTSYWEAPAIASLTYGFCCLLQFWVPSLRTIKARQPPLFSTISETGQQQNCVARAAQREEGEALTHHLLRVSTGYKNNRTPPCESTSQPSCLITSLQ